ncbi:hypothetical protein SteCoe_24679 [Stentor coeruleus]|uniref:Uncharacterized protein n=1 Tax=Stentor coeruleus TaxID=5963 RepID=A0A1R2BH38_9CILI|nr:hypothetical protein SteCoe_24679 [Stentor coeruleus]
MKKDDVESVSGESAKEQTIMSSVQASPISTMVLNESEEIKDMDFFDTRSHKIRISKRNRIMKQQLNIDSLEDSYISFFSQENFEKLVQKQMENVKSMENTMVYKLEPGSCFLWFVLPKSSFKDVISDYEIKKCKKVFKGILCKLPDCYEAHFGLGKILAHQGILDRARKHLKRALDLCPMDKLYKTWNAALQNTAFRNRTEALAVCNMFKGMFAEYPAQLEVLWGMMRLGFCKFLESPKDLEQPQVTAARIREIDDYYGYLAWSEVFMNDGLKEKSLHVLHELIRCFPTRPEAYFKLWEHYTKNAQHKQALQIASECFIRVDYPEYSVITSLHLAKSNFLLSNIHKALELLQQKHIEKPIFTVYLYQYGKLCIKTQDITYIPSGIGALTEVLRNCDKERLFKIYYWLYKGYLILQEHVSAVKALQNCAKNAKNSKKAEQIKADLKKNNKFIQSLNAAELWLGDQKDEKWDKFKGLCEEIGAFDRLEADIMLGKGFWKLGKDAEAIEYLLRTLPNSTRPQGYIQVIKFLIYKEDYRMALRESKNMLKKAKNSPIQVWIDAHIAYALSLTHNSKSEKAMVLLKCLGKTMPFIPYTFTPYLQNLRKATSVEELSQAAEKATEVSINCKETSFQLENFFTPEYLQTLNESKLNTQQICYKILQEESILTEGNSSIGMKSLNLSEVFNKYRNSKDSGSSMSSLTSEKVNNIMRNCEKGCFNGYAVSSDPKILYLIGKIAAKAGVLIEDGLCAIEDYISVLQNSLKNMRNEIRAMLVKSQLLVQVEDFETAKSILIEILPEAQVLGMSTKEGKILSILAQINN